MATNQSTPPEQKPRLPSGDDSVVDHADTESARIAELQAEIGDLEAELEYERQRRQAMIQRYERLLDERACESNAVEDEGGPSGLLNRLRRRLRRYFSTPFSEM